MDINKKKIEKMTKESGSWLKANGKIVSGIFCIIFGALLALSSKELLLNAITFGVGLFLVYYGLILIDAKGITQFIDEKINWVKKKLF